ncbi:MAG: DUF2721 domain-containing protein [Archangium sp.]|nr:DUF2721 domain-containing protein [Archangium sp.]
MADPNQLADITHTIQLSVAPVFLLTALGTLLSVLTHRLARIIDRARALEGRFSSLSAEEKTHGRLELDTLSLRARVIHRALTSGVAASLTVCLVIIAGFVGYLSQTNLGLVVAALFIIAMCLFAFALVSFLREAVMSLASLRFGQHAVIEPETK